MAHHTASFKSIRQAPKRRARNLYRLNRLRNACKEVEQAIANNDKNAASAALKQAQSDLARGVKAGVIKAGNASRKVSRLNARIKAIGSATPKAAAAPKKAAPAPKKAAAPKAAPKAKK